MIDELVKKEFVERKEDPKIEELKFYRFRQMVKTL